MKNDQVFFDDARFGWVSFNGVQFSEGASFADAHFAGEADFQGAQFGKGPNSARL